MLAQAEVGIPYDDYLSRKANLDREARLLVKTLSTPTRERTKPPARCEKSYENRHGFVVRYLELATVDSVFLIFVLLSCRVHISGTADDTHTVSDELK